MRQALEQSAVRLNCTWSFRVWRGDLEAEILSAASDAELFTLGLIGRFQPFRRRKPLVPPHAAAPLVVGVLFDASDGAERALAAALELGQRGARLRILLQGRDADTIARHREAAMALLRDAPGNATGEAAFIALPERSAAAPAHAVLHTGADVLLAAADNPLLHREILWQSLAALDCPLLVVR